MENAHTSAFFIVIAYLIIFLIVQVILILIDINRLKHMYDNYNYPPGADTPDAPWNQVEVPHKDFEVTCSQSLSRTAIVTTNNYTPGASGVDYERDDEGGYIAEGYQDPDDTSDTNWKEEYTANGYCTPLELIQLLKEYLEKDLEKWKEEDKKDPHKWASTQVKKYEFLISECDCWTDDETEFVEGE